MKAKIEKVKIPVWDNYLPPSWSTVAVPQRPPDKYIEAENLICPVCGALLQSDITEAGKYYCWRCKQYGIEAP